MLRRILPWMVCAGLAWASVSEATVPATMSLQGALQGAMGGPAPDGNYAITVALYKDAVGGLPIWTEGPAAVTAKNGAFAHLAGSQNPLPVAQLGALPQVWIGVSVNGEPEYQRRQLMSTPFALRAALAEVEPAAGAGDHRGGLAVVLEEGIAKAKTYAVLADPHEREGDRDRLE